MKEVVFLASDASFKSDSSAILGVKDYYDGKHYQKIVSETGSSLHAEEQAIRFAIDIAITKSYLHVVFIYDCQSVKIEKFLKRYRKNFLTMQMLWLPRDHISSVDKITKKHFSDSEIALMNSNNSERDSVVFKSFSEIKLSYMEAHILNLLNKEHTFVGQVESERIILLSTLYILLSNSEKKKVKRILKETLSSRDLNRIFKRKTKQDYIAAINFYKLPYKDDLFDLMKINSID